MSGVQPEHARSVTSGLLFTSRKARALHTIRRDHGRLVLPLPVIELNGALVSDAVHRAGAWTCTRCVRERGGGVAKDLRAGLSPVIAPAATRRVGWNTTTAAHPAMVWYRDEKLAPRDRACARFADPRAALDEQVAQLARARRSRRDARGWPMTFPRCLGGQVQIYLPRNLPPRSWELTIQDGVHPSPRDWKPAPGADIESRDSWWSATASMTRMVQPR